MNESITVWAANGRVRIEIDASHEVTIDLNVEHARRLLGELRRAIDLADPPPVSCGGRD